ncbi:MAG: hypothetical protein ACE5HT_01555 [Gemmatimonadales bacterium]
MPDFIWFQNVVLPLAGMGLGAFTLFGLYRIAMRQLDRGEKRRLGNLDESVRAELELLRERLEVVEGNSMRLEELEERMDFAERLLTKPGQSALPGRD